MATQFQILLFVDRIYESPSHTLLWKWGTLFHPPTSSGINDMVFAMHLHMLLAPLIATLYYLDTWGENSAIASRYF